MESFLLNDSFTDSSDDFEWDSLNSPNHPIHWTPQQWIPILTERFTESNTTHWTREEQITDITKCFADSNTVPLNKTKVSHCCDSKIRWFKHWLADHEWKIHWIKQWLSEITKWFTESNSDLLTERENWIVVMTEINNQGSDISYNRLSAHAFHTLSHTVIKEKSDILHHFISEWANQNTVWVC